MERVFLGLALRTTLVALLCAVGAVLHGQEFGSESYPMGHYVAPLRGALGLSGSFGEVRSRHFHAGADLRTGGQEGKPVYSVAAGRIVRINVSTTGYGLALYVAHPNGSMSVYGHLQRFAPPLAQWVREQLYARRRHTSEIYPTAGWRVEAGELLGYSGNTGSSGGPHLHFELRKDGGKLPYNPALSGVRHGDSIPPHFRRLYLYMVDTLAYEPSLLARRSVAVERVSREVYRVRDTVAVGLVSGFGVDVRDTVNRHSLVCNVGDLRMYVEDTVHFSFNIDCIDFSETGYADAHIDHALYSQMRTRVHLLFRLPGNALSRSVGRGGGLVRLDSGRVVWVRVEARDGLGNASELRFAVRGTGQPAKYASPDSTSRVGWQSGGVLEGLDYRVRIAARALYYDLDVGVSSGWVDSSSFAPWVSVHCEGRPLHKPLELGIRVRGLDSRLRSKLYVAKWNAREGKYGYYAPAVPKGGGYYGAGVNDFGRYTLMLDTVAPVLESRALGAICGRRVAGADFLRIGVRDAESSVASIDGTVDGGWMLWEFEPKRGEAVHWLRSGPSVAGGAHSLVLRVVDRLGNARAHECSFVW